MKLKILLAILTFITAQASGLSVATAADYYTLTANEGLAGNSIGAIMKDSVGFIWIGNKFGVSRFDGYKVKNYAALHGYEVRSIEEQDADTLLIGTTAGFYYFSRRTDTSVKLDLPTGIVKAIRKTGHGQFLVGTESGLYLVNNHLPQQILLESGLSPCNHITAIIREDEHIYWFATNDGLGRLDLRTLNPVIYRMPEGLDNTNAFVCLTRMAGHIYAGSFNKGVFRFDTTTHTFTPVKGFEHNLILTIDGEENRLFVGTNGQGLKVMSLADGRIETFVHNEKEKTSLSSNTVTAFLYDKGIQWVGTQFGGLNYTPPGGSRFAYYNWKGFYSTDYRVRCFYMLPDGDKLIGTRTGLFYISEKRGLLRRYTMESGTQGLRSNIILSINKVNDKVLIATFGGGMHVFDEKTLQLKDLSQEEPFLYGCFFHFTQDGLGNLWIASQEELYQSTLDGHILKKYDTMNSELKVNVVYLYADRLNRLWIGTKFGLFLMDIPTGKLRSDCFGTPIKEEVKYIMEDSHRNVWVCTENGLYRIGEDLQVAEVFNDKNLLPDNLVNSIQEDPEGNLWITTLKSIVKYNPTEHVHYTYSKQNGLNDLDFNNSVVLAPDSTLWWPNEGGLIYTSAHEQADKHPTHLRPTITSYATADYECDFPYADPSEEIVLSPSNNHISFRLSYLDYSLPYNSSYEYKLEGYDADWVRLTGINEAAYENLPSGRYTFCLRTPGQNDETPQQVTVVVLRSYTNLIVFSLIAVLIVALVIYFRHHIWKLKKRMTNERRVLNTVQEQSKGTKKPVLPETKAGNLQEELLNYMATDKPYLNAKLSIGDVAAHLECTEQELSQLLNNHINVNFANFVNAYRVNEIKSRLNQENLSRYTLKALSEQCGFSSKTTFYRVFKNVTGMTPSEYCKSQNLIIIES
ncbi:MAG: two-component regulator propeller domain-containing protein [Bacteroides sp.]|nr:two-component regulator propeller domain-containing protein [Bacteroides sp.]